MNSYILDFPVKQEIIDFYKQQGRYYHNISHIEEMLVALKSFRHKLDNTTYWSFALAIIFHDIYQKGDAYNSAEKLSVQYAKQHLKEHKRFYELNYDFKFSLVDTLISVTDYDYITLNDENKNLMVYFDLIRFNEKGSMLSKRHLEVLKEHPNVSLDTFINRRVVVLRELYNKLRKVELKEFYGVNFANILNGLEESINLLKSMTFNVGVYPGSFNPLHKGHQDIIKQAEQVFDKVVLVQGVNPSKNDVVPLKSKTHQVIHHDGFIKDVFDGFKNHKVTMIRGLRNASDLDYEMQYKQNLIDLGFDYSIAYFISSPDVRHISSSSIRSTEALELETEQWK